MADDDGHHWIPVADLMAGVVGVAMMMLVVALLQSQTQSLRADAEVAKRLEAGKDQRKKSLEDPLTALKGLVDHDPDLRRLMVVTPGEGVIELTAGTFPTLSACLDDRVRGVLQHAAPLLRGLVDPQSEGGQRYCLSIVGHTDSDGFTSLHEGCGWFDSNFSLSARRAEEARKAIVDGWPETAARRVAIAGHADLDPKPGASDIEAGKAANRRVEIRVLTPSANDPSAACH